MLITTSQNKRLHQLLSILDIMDLKPAIINKVTNGRTSSSAEMMNFEAAALISSLEVDEKQKCGKMRGKIIHYLCLLGYVNGDGKPDYLRINSFIAQIGTNNPRRAQLLYLRPKELHAVCNQVEAMYKNEIRRSRKSFSNQ